MESRIASSGTPTQITTSQYDSRRKRIGGSFACRLGPPNILLHSRERRISRSVRTELNAGTTSVPLVGVSG